MKHRWSSSNPPWIPASLPPPSPAPSLPFFPPRTVLFNKWGFLSCLGLLEVTPDNQTDYHSITLHKDFHTYPRSNNSVPIFKSLLEKTILQSLFLLCRSFWKSNLSPSNLTFQLILSYLIHRHIRGQLASVFPMTAHWSKDWLSAHDPTPTQKVTTRVKCWLRLPFCPASGCASRATALGTATCLQS